MPLNVAANAEVGKGKLDAGKHSDLGFCSVYRGQSAKFTAGEVAPAGLTSTHARPERKTDIQGHNGRNYAQKNSRYARKLRCGTPLDLDDLTGVGARVNNPHGALLRARKTGHHKAGKTMEPRMLKMQA